MDHSTRYIDLDPPTVIEPTREGIEITQLDGGVTVLSGSRAAFARALDAAAAWGDER